MWGDSSDFYFDIPVVGFQSTNGGAVLGTGGSVPVSSGGAGAKSKNASGNWLDIVQVLSNTARGFYDDVANHGIQEQQVRAGQNPASQAYLQNGTIGIGTGALGGGTLLLVAAVVVVILLLKR